MSAGDWPPVTDLIPPATRLSAHSLTPAPMLVRPASERGLLRDRNSPTSAVFRPNRAATAALALVSPATCPPPPGLGAAKPGALGRRGTATWAAAMSWW